jgi:hypothetical protein
MKKIFFLSLFLFQFLFLVAQPNRDSLSTVYDYYCFGSVPYDNTGTAESYFNDPNGTCITNEWIVIFTDANGNISYYTPVDWILSQPGSNGFYDFNNLFWQCCEELTVGNSNLGLGGGTGNDGSSGGNVDCDCEWNYNEVTGILTIYCPCIGNEE